MQTSEENTQGIVHQNEEGRCPEIDHHICSLSKTSLHHWFPSSTQLQALVGWCWWPALWWQCLRNAAFPDICNKCALFSRPFLKDFCFGLAPPSKILRIYLKWKQETGFHLSEFLLTQFNQPSQLFKLLIHKSKNGLISSLEKGCSSCYWCWSPL